MREGCIRSLESTGNVMFPYLVMDSWEIHNIPTYSFVCMVDFIAKTK